MSLLMEALRKAEEAKRRAAQGSEPAKPEPVALAEEVAVPALPVENATVAPAIESSDDLMAYLLADTADEASVSRVTAPTNDLFEARDQSSDPKRTSSASALDIPLGFSLDMPITASEEPVSLKSAIEEPISEEIALIPDFAKPLTIEISIPDDVDDVIDSPPPKKAPEPEEPAALQFGDDIFASLKLTDAPPVTPEPAVTDFLLGLAVHATEPKKVDEQPKVQEQPLTFLMPEPEIAPSPAPSPSIAPELEIAQQPVNSSAADSTLDTTPQISPIQPLSVKETAKAEKFKKAVATRKSVQALFASKTKVAQTPKNRLFVLGSVAAGIIVIVIGGWLTLSLMTGSGNQYVIPPMTDNMPAPELTSEPAAQIADITLATPAIDLLVAQEPSSDLSLPTSIDSVIPADSTNVAPSLELPAVTMPTATIADTSLAESTGTTLAIPSTTPATETAATAPSVTEPVVTEPAVSEPDVANAVTSPVPDNTTMAAPVVDPETGLVELPLDAGQAGSGSVTGGSLSSIRISRSEPMRNPDMQMLTAWSAYQQGDYAAARILYQQSLARDPDNRDALLGVAASAMQQGDQVTARQTYNRLLNLNPRDPLARAGLLETTAAADPIQRETDLKALQTDHPDIAAVSYSLGNLYASQQRWHDAQQAYYEALLTARTQAEGPVSPDYAFNLAISLERINQPEAALNFYREALALTAQHVPGFDMTVLDQRLRALERSRP